MVLPEDQPEKTPITNAQRIAMRDMAIEKMRAILNDPTGKKLFDNIMATFDVATREEQGLEIDMSSTVTGILTIAMMTAKAVATVEDES